MSARRRIAIVAVAGAAAAACAESRAESVVALGAPETVISTESELLAVPADLALDARGRLYVLDQAAGQIVRVEEDGATTVIGRPGSGPGELASPLSLAVRGDSLLVDDRGNGRVLVLDAAGTQVRTWHLPPKLPGTMAFGRGGEAVVATLGFGEGLAQLLDADGAPLRTVGALVTPSVPLWDFSAMKADVRRGRIPNVLRNHAFPVSAEDGGTWLTLVSEGEVRRYDASGRQQWARTLETPETAALRERFFTRNREEKNPAAFHSLQLFADAVEVDGELWVLLYGEEENPSAIAVLGRDGRVVRRYTLPGVAGARMLAVDAGRGRLYLGVPSAAEVVAVPLPRG